MDEYEAFKGLIKSAVGGLTPSEAAQQIAAIDKMRGSIPPWLNPPNTTAANPGRNLGQQIAMSPFAVQRKRFEVKVGPKIGKWLDDSIGVHARPYVQVVMFSARVSARLEAENFQRIGDRKYGTLAESEDADCVILMQRPESSPAAGAVLVLKVPESIIEQIISDEVREKLEAG